jgi:hypothetical protein
MKQVILNDDGLIRAIVADPAISALVTLSDNDQLIQTFQNQHYGENPTALLWPDFLMRFDRYSELPAVFAATVADPSGNIGATFEIAKSFGYVDLNDFDLQQAIQALVDAGALTQMRAGEILTP